MVYYCYTHILWDLSKLDLGPLPRHAASQAKVKDTPEDRHREWRLCNIGPFWFICTHGCLDSSVKHILQVIFATTSATKTKSWLLGHWFHQCSEGPVRNLFISPLGLSDPAIYIGTSWRTFDTFTILVIPVVIVVITYCKHTVLGSSYLLIFCKHICIYI